MEENRRRKLSNGIQYFEEIRRGGYVYVDKTDMVWSIANGRKYNFLGRPRRFGKSLLVSTLQCYFEGRKDLFEGLRIMELEKEWISRPVFRFDFSGAETAQDLELRLDNYLRRYEQVFGRDTWEQTLGDRLLSLLKRANEKTGCQVAVLVDEYDAPLQHSLFNDEEHKKLVSVYRGFFPALKEGELYVKCVFLTGITKFTQLSLFSTLNTVSILSLLPQYETLCGMTRQEIVDNYAPELDAMARKNGWGMEETLSALKNDYDGYYFSAERNEPVYNPFSLVNALDTGRISNYWASSGGSQMLTEMLSRQGANIMDLDNSLVDGDLMETSDVSVDNLPLFLYQCGYLTIKDYRDGVYYLGFPNGEVRRSLYKVILPIALSRSSSDVMSSISRMRVDLSSGDIEGAMLSLKELVAGTPYASKGEKSLEERYQFILVQAFYLCGFRIEQHRKVSKGEIDVVAYRGNLTLVMELKVGNGSRGIEKGEEQAYDRNYLSSFCASGRDVYLIVVSFSTKEGGISGYKVRKVTYDSEGNISL